jgi:hypothetical protein
MSISKSVARDRRCGGPDTAFPGSSEFLCGSQNGTFRSLGQRNRDEIAFRVEVVFAGFIDHSDLMMFSRLRVGNDSIELSQFQ